MEKYNYDEKNGLWYEKLGDYYLPCLELPEKENKPINIWDNDIYAILNSVSVYFTQICLHLIS